MGVGDMDFESRSTIGKRWHHGQRWRLESASVDSLRAPAAGSSLGNAATDSLESATGCVRTLESTRMGSLERARQCKWSSVRNSELKT